MTFEKRDWWWAMGMFVVCASVANKGGWLQPGRVFIGRFVWCLFGVLNLATH